MEKSHLYRHVARQIADKHHAPRSMRAHIFFATITGSLLLVAAYDAVYHQAGKSDSESTMITLTFIFMMALIVAVIYNEYYVPMLVCAVLLVLSTRPGVLAPEIQFSVLVPGFLAGLVHLALSTWWRARWARLPQRVRLSTRVREARAGLFEVGYRYLAAWGALMLVALVVTVAGRAGDGLARTEGTIQEAGGIVVLIDLLALSLGRFRRAREVLAAACPEHDIYSQMDIVTTAGITAEVLRRETTRHAL